MRVRTDLLRLAFGCALSLVAAHALAVDATAEPAWQKLAYAPAPADNPLKGLVPYVDAANPDGFPHSMEFSYLALSSVVTGPDRYDWTTLERLLDAVAARGHQAVLRFYSEYPGRKDGLPEFLVQGGVQIFRSQRANTPPRPPADIETPDYENAALRSTLRNFIATFGARYDGDPRIGFITAGLLGHWGEWHDYPLESQFASKAVQTEVMDAYEAAFHATPILLRYPAGAQDSRYASNASRPFGYHDDSFAWGTLSSKNSWHFMPLMTKAGDAALGRWKTSPIGGEVRPEAWGKVFDAADSNGERGKIEDFCKCVDATHATWLMDSGMFKTANPEQRRARAIEEVGHMGYAFQVAQVAFNADPATGTFAISLLMENHGVAPFYYAWPMQFGLVDSAGKLVLARPLRAAPLTLKGILPGQPPTRLDNAFDISGLVPGHYRVLLRVPNPLPKGQPVRFANTAQDADIAGWLTLGDIAR